MRLASGTPPIADEEISAWRVGLEGAALLAAHFPAFFAEQAAGMQVTPPGLLGCIAAFVQLVEQAGLPLRPIGDAALGGDLEFDDTPEHTLIMYDDVSPEYMGDLGYWIMVPRPEYFGLGVESMVDEGGLNPNPLTVLLWHLYQHTPLGMGVALDAYAEHLGDDVLLEIRRIRPLPADAPIHLLPAHLTIPEAQAIALSRDDVLRATALLVAYAFGKTGNELADHSDYDVEAIRMGETDEQWDWAQLPELARLSAEAQALESCYATWSARVDQDPDAIRRLGIAFHKAARAARVELLEAPKTLLTLLDRRLAYEEQRV